MTHIQTLPIELVSLTHHVELHKDGWWDAALQRIVLAGIWLTDRDPTLDEIRAYLRKRFAVELPRQKTLETLEALVAAGDLVEARSARFKISEAAHARLDEARATAEQTERRVRDHFSELVARCCPTSDSDVLWHDFNDHLLIPLIKVSAFN